MLVNKLESWQDAFDKKTEEYYNSLAEYQNLRHDFIMRQSKDKREFAEYQIQAMILHIKVGIACKELSVIIENKPANFELKNRLKRFAFFETNNITKLDINSIQ